MTVRMTVYKVRLSLEPNIHKGFQIQLTIEWE